MVRGLQDLISPCGEQRGQRGHFPAAGCCLPLYGVAWAPAGQSLSPGSVQGRVWQMAGLVRISGMALGEGQGTGGCGQD